MARKKTPSPYDDEAGRGTGAFNASGAPASTEVSTTGPPAAASAYGTPEAVEGIPDTGLFGAVISVLFFFPLGIFAVLAALQVRPRWKRGDRTGARAASDRAERLTYAAVGIFIVLAILGAIVYLVYWFSGPRTHR
jgi:hypothetical protein